MALEQRIQKFLHQTLTQGEVAGLRKVLNSSVLTKELRRYNAGAKGVLGTAIYMHGSNVEFIATLFENVFEKSDPYCLGMQQAIEGRNKDIQDLLFPFIRPHQAGKCLEAAVSTRQLSVANRLASMMSADQLVRFIGNRLNVRSDEKISLWGQRVMKGLLAHAQDPLDVRDQIMEGWGSDDHVRQYFEQWSAEYENKTLQSHLKTQQKAAARPKARKI